MASSLARLFIIFSTNLGLPRLSIGPTQRRQNSLRQQNVHQNEHDWSLLLTASLYGKQVPHVTENLVSNILFSFYFAQNRTFTEITNNNDSQWTRMVTMSWTVRLQRNDNCPLAKNKTENHAYTRNRPTKTGRHIHTTEERRKHTCTRSSVSALLRLLCCCFEWLLNAPWVTLLLSCAKQRQWWHVIACRYHKNFPLNIIHSNKSSVNRRHRRQ